MATMHCTMEDLLALRAGEGSVWARRHSASCAVCQAELEALYQRVAQLKALPSLRPARDGWPAVRAALRTARRQRRRVMAGWSSLAAAAALTAILVMQPFGSRASSGSELTELNTIKQRSASLESRLANDELDRRVMSGWEAALAADLEDRIAVIDGQLELGAPPQAPAAQVVDLWRQRVNLMERLYTVRRAAYQGM
jgi:hypothetical protein